MNTHSNENTAKVPALKDSRDILICNRNSYQAIADFNSLQTTLFHRILLQYSDAQTAILRRMENGELEFPNHIPSSFEVDVMEFGHNVTYTYYSLLQMLRIIVHMTYNVDQNVNGFHAPLLGSVHDKPGDTRLTVTPTKEYNMKDGHAIGRPFEVSRHQIVTINEKILPYLIYNGKTYGPHNIIIGNAVINYRKLISIKPGYSKRLFFFLMCDRSYENKDYGAGLRYPFHVLLDVLSLSAGNNLTKPSKFISKILEPFRDNVMQNTGMEVSYDYFDKDKKPIKPPFSAGRSGSNLCYVGILVSRKEAEDISDEKILLVKKWLDKPEIVSAFGDRISLIFGDRTIGNVIWTDILNLEKKMKESPDEFTEAKAVNCLKRTIASQIRII